MTNNRKYTLNGFIYEKKMLFIAFLLSTLVLSIIAPFKSYILQWLIDAKSQSDALRFLGIGLIIVLSSHIIEYISRQIFTLIATKNIEQIRNQIMAAQSIKTMGEYLSENTGDLLSCLTNDMRIIFDDYYMSIFNIIFWGGMGTTAIFMLGSISPTLLLISAFLGLASILVPKVMASKMNQRRTKYSEDNAVYTGKTSELLKGFEALIASGATFYMKRVHGKVAASNWDKELKLQTILNYSTIAASLVSWILNILIMLVGVLLVFNGSISMGSLVTAYTLANFIIGPFRFVANTYAKLKSTTTIKNKIESAMNHKGKPDGTEAISLVENISIKGLSFTYPGADNPAIRDFELYQGSNEKIALVGGSGSGKSTLIKILHRYYDEYEGSVLINGNPLNSIKRDIFYQRVALIPQTPFIFSDTIYNNICLFQDFSDEAVSKAISKAGLRDFVTDQKDDLNTVLAENGRNLSGGQIQRIAIARAIIRQCDLMLVDEATSNLDVATTHQVMENLLNLDCAVIVVTHDIFGEYMKKFDNIYYLEHGRITEQGKLNELI